MISVSSLNDPVWHSRVWRLSWPIILANLTVPLVGTVDTAVMGRMPNANYIAAVALGAMVFSAVYWLFGFLRMGTTALSAQAHGAGAQDVVRATFLRAALLASTIAILLLLLQRPLLATILVLIEAEPAVESLTSEYLSIRLLGTPAYLLHLAQLGVLFGTQRMKTAMVLVLIFNIENLLLDVLLAVGLGWGVAGVAWGTVLAEWTAALLGGAVLWRQLRLGGREERAAYIKIFWDPLAWRRLIAISRDLLVRTFFVQLPFLVNTLLAAKLGSLTLAGNAILMQFFFIVTYALDGFAHTAEALIGYAVGKKSRQDVQDATRYCAFSAFIFSLILTALLALFPTSLISAMTNLPDVTASALLYYPWICILPLAGVWAFLFDGVFIGATRIRELRNAMFVAATLYILVVVSLFEYLGNTALWLGLTVFMLARAVLLGLGYPRLLRGIETSSHPAQPSA